MYDVYISEAYVFIPLRVRRERICDLTRSLLHPNLNETQIKTRVSSSVHERSAYAGGDWTSVSHIYIRVFVTRVAVCAAKGVCIANYAPRAGPRATQRNATYRDRSLPVRAHARAAPLTVQSNKLPVLRSREAKRGRGAGEEEEEEARRIERF